jgi:hypothetical protein
VTAKRIPLRRLRRFSPGALALFIELDGKPKERKSFSSGSRQLAELLGLEAEWFTGNSPLDQRAEPHRSPGCQSYADWCTCRAVREELLAAAKRRADAPGLQ